MALAQKQKTAETDSLDDAMSAAFDFSEPATNTQVTQEVVAKETADKPATVIASTVAASKFETEFVDVDDEDEEAPRPPTSTATQIDTKNMNAQELISHSISLVSKHLKAANASVKKIEESLKELEALVKTQKGYAKKELSKVIKKKTTHLTELKAHVAEGN